jgi:hypothetical protein
LGFLAAVRVCATCFNLLQKSGVGKKVQAPVAEVQAPVAAVAARFETPTEPAYVVEQVMSSCTCNMPLCICISETPELPGEQATAAPTHPTVPVAKPKAATPSTFSGFGFGGFGGSAGKLKYDLTENLNEQCRDAVKNKDLDGVRQLLGAKASGSYMDRTGNTLLHLAAMFDHLPVVELLIANGADMSIKNPAGETSIDLAPPSLQLKMKGLHM